METVVLQRIAISVIILIVSYVVVRALGKFNRWQLQQDSNGKNLLPVDLKFGRPILLYFWTLECSQCKVQEREIDQAVETLRQAGTSVEVRRLNAHEDTQLVKNLHVMTVPTTVLLDVRGTVIAWNPGLTGARRIVGQYLDVKPISRTSKTSPTVQSKNVYNNLSSRSLSRREFRLL